MSETSRRIAGILGILGAALMLIWAGLPQRASWTGVQIEGQIYAPEVDAPAPQFSTQLADGTPFSLESTLGQIVIINFWATWCLPCRDEMQMLETVFRRSQQSGQPINIVAVNLREDAQTARAWAAQYGLTYPIALDPDGTIGTLYALRGQPTTFILRPDGTIAHIALGAVTETQLETAIRPLLISETLQG